MKKTSDDGNIGFQNFNGRKKSLDDDNDDDSNDDDCGDDSDIDDNNHDDDDDDDERHQMEPARLKNLEDLFVQKILFAGFQ